MGAIAKAIMDKNERGIIGMKCVRKEIWYDTNELARIYIWQNTEHGVARRIREEVIVVRPSFRIWQGILNEER